MHRDIKIGWLTKLKIWMENIPRAIQISAVMLFFLTAIVILEQSVPDYITNCIMPTNSQVHYHSQGCGHQNYQSQSHRNLTDAGKRGIPSQYRRTVTNSLPDKVRPNDSEGMARNQALAKG